MMTLAPIRSPVHAVSYFERSEHANYYASDDVCPSIWLGAGAEKLGLSGQMVDSKQFERFLKGNIAGVTIGTKRNGKTQHKCGWDAQISPSKSVSILALVAGDERIIEAHDLAVKRAFQHIEAKGAYTRIHNRDSSGKDSIRQIATGNLIIPVFRHNTSRSLDPQLHSHGVIINATMRPDGEWRSIESRHFYAMQKEAGLYYRQVLASLLRDMGYTIMRSADDNFEIGGVPDKLISTFSKRRNDINEELDKFGYTRESASAALKEKVSHSTRKAKHKVDQSELLKKWRMTVKEHDVDLDALVNDSIIKSQNKGWSDRDKVKKYDELKKITNQAISSISERDSVFSREVLMHEINKLAVGYGIPEDRVIKILDKYKDEGLLLGDRKTKIYSSQFKCWHEVEAYTTKENILSEEKMINTMLTGVTNYLPEFNTDDINVILEESENESIKLGFSGWTVEQKDVASGILSSKDQFVACQGSAGTAKTSTVLRTVASQFKQKGYDVIGMAPSSSACSSLQEGAGLNTVITVASHLLSFDKPYQRKKKLLWLVDEASLLSAKDTFRLLSKAKQCNARVILVGDTKQLGSVQAGSAFRQLQENGISTFKLKEIVRQDNVKTLDAVYSSIQGDAKRVLEKLSAGGGKVVELPGDSSVRHKKMVDTYLYLSHEDRNKTLLIEPSREGRDELTQLLRKELCNRRGLIGDYFQTQRLDKKDITKAALRDAMSFECGDVVKFTREYKSKNVSKNSYWNVIERDTEKNVLILSSQDGREVIWNPASWGTKAQVFTPVACDLKVGDRLIWTANDRDKGLINGTKVVVTQINNVDQEVSIKLNNGKKITLNIDQMNSQHWNYDYVTTVHASQGRTSDRVIYHAESFRKNLASQKAFYVAISRAKNDAIIVTDKREELIEQIKEHTGEKQVAIEKEDKLVSVNNEKNDDLQTSFWVPKL